MELHCRLDRTYISFHWVLRQCCSWFDCHHVLSPSIGFGSLRRHPWPVNGGWRNGSGSYQSHPETSQEGQFISSRVSYNSVLSGRTETYNISNSDPLWSLLHCPSRLCSAGKTGPSAFLLAHSQAGYGSFCFSKSFQLTCASFCPFWFPLASTRSSQNS